VIVEVHHHLRRGGVSRVMCSLARILRDAGEDVMLMAAEAPSGSIPDGVHFAKIPELAYGRDYDSDHVDTLVAKMREAAGEDAIWHIHNHSLGKNPQVTEAVIRLAEAGERILLQPHDFAEDGRPGNLRLLRSSLPEFPSKLYPYSGRVQYAVLQERDRHVLCKSGVPREYVHVLPNPIEGENLAASDRHPPERLLYLTRGIRRKNIGEFLFWAIRYASDLECATSLIPDNPVELKIFREWEAFVSETLQVKPSFGIGLDDGKSFADVVGWGDLCLTTSVAEGFGMTFLEPYLMGRGVTGRDLPEITAGFKQDGVRLGGLYNGLPVPLDWVDDAFWRRGLASVNIWRRAMSLREELHMQELKEAWTLPDEQIDFGRLDETAQRSVLTHLQSEGFSRWTRKPRLQLGFLDEDMAHNRQVLETQYDGDSCRKRLQEVLKGFSSDRCSPEFADGHAVRDAFAALETLTLLRT